MTRVNMRIGSDNNFHYSMTRSRFDDMPTTAPLDAKGQSLRTAIEKARDELGRATWHLAGSSEDGDESSRAAKLAIHFAIDYLTDELGMKVER